MNFLVTGTLKEETHRRFFLQSLTSFLSQNQWGSLSYSLAFSRFLFDELSDGMIPYELYDFYHFRENSSSVTGTKQDILLNVSSLDEAFLPALKAILQDELSSMKIFNVDFELKKPDRVIPDGEAFSGGCYIMNLLGALLDETLLKEVMGSETEVLFLDDSAWLSASSAYTLEDGLLAYLSKINSPVELFSEGLFFRPSLEELQKLI